MVPDLRKVVAFLHRFPDGFQRLLLDLANAFAGDPEAFSDFFERPFFAIVQTESHGENFAFAFRKCREDFLR